MREFSSCRRHKVDNKFSRRQSQITISWQHEEHLNFYKARDRHLMKQKVHQKNVFFLFKNKIRKVRQPTICRGSVGCAFKIETVSSSTLAVKAAIVSTLVLFSSFAFFI